MLLATSCNLFGGAGAGAIQDGPTAPFTLANAHAFLWATDVNNDGTSATGMLVIANGDASCASLTSAYSYADWNAVVGSGSGLVFILYSADYSGSENALSWDGLYLGSFGYSEALSAQRQMLAVAYHDSFVYVLDSYYGGGNSWIEVRSSGSGLTGDFATSHWRGQFDATDCGTYGGEYYTYEYD
jgi:hypothetical protein